MSATTGRPALAVPWPVLALFAALLAIYAPTYHDLSAGPWRTQAHGHGPFVAVVAAWLFWRHREAILRHPAQPRDVSGSALLALGLAAYAVGRSQEIPLLEAGSQLPVLAGILLLLRGFPALRAAAFPLVFLAFTVPLPGIFVDAITATLKEGVSVAVEEILFRAGLPVARSGVVLTLGQYQLLMADACSGLHSMFSLAALGLLFIHLAARDSALHNGLLATAILPIAFAANVARVLALSLITYRLGNAAGQGFLHDVAGIGLFAVALGSLFALDALLWRALRARKGH
jgi:exosortase B